MSKTTKSDILKKQLVLAMEKSLGVITTACKSVGIARSTFYEWYNSDINFKNEIDDIKEVATDYVVSKLFEQIKNNNHVSTIFYLKTKGKDRGFVERQEIVQRVDLESELQLLSDEDLEKRLIELRNAIQN
jgi:hypothetical protein